MQTAFSMIDEGNDDDPKGAVTVDIQSESTLCLIKLAHINHAGGCLHHSKDSSKVWNMESSARDHVLYQQKCDNFIGYLDKLGLGCQKASHLFCVAAAPQSNRAGLSDQVHKRLYVLVSSK